MDGSSLFVAVMPVTTLIALFTGIALPFIAASRPGRSHPRRRAGADPPRQAGADAAPAGYLYVPCARIGSRGYPAPARRRVQQVPIVKKTAQLIYYASDSWDRREAVISPGCISREQFETDTRCGDDSEHCPHRDDRCRHGYPAGVIPVPGDRPGRPAGCSSPPARPPKTTCTAGNASKPDRPHRQHRRSGSCAAPWPTPTPTAAAQPGSSSRRAAGTRRRSGPREGNAPTWPAPGRHDGAAPGTAHSPGDGTPTGHRTGPCGRRPLRHHLSDGSPDARLGGRPAATG